MSLEATISERGNGFPDVGSYVPGDDGNLYRVVATGCIFTGNSPGVSNYMCAQVDEADWSDVDSDDEVFPASVSVQGADEDDE